MSLASGIGALTLFLARRPASVAPCGRSLAVKHRKRGKPAHDYVRRRIGNLRGFRSSSSVWGLWLKTVVSLVRVLDRRSRGIRALAWAWAEPRCPPVRPAPRVGGCPVVIELNGPGYIAVAAGQRQPDLGRRRELGGGARLDRRFVVVAAGRGFESPRRLCRRGAKFSLTPSPPRQDLRPLSVLAALHHAHRWISRSPAVPRCTGIRQANGREP
jgi:hypothetical protein